MIRLIQTGPTRPVLALAWLLSLHLAGCAGPSTPCPETPAAAAQEPASVAPVAAADPQPAVAPAPLALSLWTDNARRKAIIDFVARVTDPKSENYVPAAERIAVFDNDGTLWSEQPMYVQLAFVLDRIKALAPQHPEWKKKQPYKAVLEGDMKTLMAMGNEGIIPLMMSSHAATTADEFDTVVREWLKTARHPKYNQLYTDLTYAPMVELLAYLRANDFKTFIVSGGGVAFMRPWVEAAYGIPPEQVVGSRIKAEWKDSDAGGNIVRLAELDFINDGPGKPVGIYNALGRRPIFAAGNSDGDLAMLKWTAGGSGARLALIVHHTDDLRETAYDRKSGMGKLDKGLDVAQQLGAQGKPWILVDMKQDWTKVFRSDAPVGAPGPGPQPMIPSQPAAATQSATTTTPPTTVH